MRFGRRWCLAAIAILFGCYREAPILEVPTANARALVIAKLTQARQISLLRAMDVESPSTSGFLAVPRSDRDEGGTIVALRYACPLATLGLGEGDLLPAADDPAGGVIPAPNGVSSALIRGSVTLETAQEIPPELASFRIYFVRPQFPIFNMTRLKLAGTSTASGTVTLAVGLGGDAALVGTRDGKLYRIADDVREVAQSTSAPYLAAFRSGSKLWLARQDGKIVTASIAHDATLGAFADAPPIDVPHDLKYMSLDGTSDQDPVLFATLDAHTIQILRGGRWSTLDLGGRTAGDKSLARVRWSERERLAFAIAVIEDDVLAIDPNTGAISDRPPGLDHNPMMPEHASAISNTTGGLVIGTTEARLLHFDGTSFEPFTDSGYKNRVFVVEALDDGFIFGGSIGDLSMYHPIYGFGGELTLSGDVVRIAPIEHGFVAVTVSALSGVEVQRLLKSNDAALAACGP